MAVTLDIRLRRTSARGWGTWTEAELDLGALPEGDAVWRVDDPVAVGLPTTHGPVVVRLAEVDEVYLRPVRFRTEAFWGMDADIVVCPAERFTTELAVPAELARPLADRLRALLAPN